MKKRFLIILSFVFTIAFTIAGLSLTYSNNYSSHEITAEAATTKAENRTIQTKLKRWGYYTGAVDGIYGPLTKKAVRYFQSKNGLAVDGIVGPKTASALGMTLSSSGSSKVLTSSSICSLVN